MVLRDTATNKVIRFRIRTLQPLGYISLILDLIIIYFFLLFVKK